MSLLGCSLFYKLFLGTQRLKWSELSLDQRTVQLSAICMFICGATFGIQISVQHIHHLSHLHVDGPWYLISLLLYLFAMYFFLIVRLFSVFKNSAFALHPMTLRIHIIIWILIMMTAFSIFPLLLQSVNIQHVPFRLLVALIPIGTVAMIHLMFLFNYKLFHLVLMRKQTIIAGDDTMNMELNQMQLAMLRTVRKHSLLSTVVIVSCGVFIACPVAGISEMQEKYLILSTIENERDHIISAVLNVMILVAQCIGATALWLGFSVNSALYLRCCSCCDAQCEVLCHSMAKSRTNGKGIICAESPGSNVI